MKHFGGLGGVGGGCRVEDSGYGNIVIFFFLSAGLSRYPTGGLEVTRELIVCLVIFIGRN